MLLLGLLGLILLGLLEYPIGCLFWRIWFAVYVVYFNV
jgi:hypothetical protein